MKALPKLGDVLGGIGGEAEVCEKKFFRTTIQDGVEGIIPEREVDIGRRSCGHDVRSVFDANSGGVSGKGDACARIEKRNVVRSVAGSVKDVEFLLTDGQSFSAVEDTNILRGDGERFTEEARQVIAPEASSAGKELCGIGEMGCAFAVNVNAEPRIFAQQRAGGSGVIEVDVREQDRFEIGKFYAVGKQLRAESFERGGGTGIDDGGVAVVGCEESGGDGARTAIPVDVEDGEGRHGRLECYEI